MRQGALGFDFAGISQQCPAKDPADALRVGPFRLPQNGRGKRFGLFHDKGTVQQEQGMCWQGRDISSTGDLHRVRQIEGGKFRRRCLGRTISAFLC